MVASSSGSAACTRVATKSMAGLSGRVQPLGRGLIVDRRV